MNKTLTVMIGLALAAIGFAIWLGLASEDVPTSWDMLSISREAVMDGHFILGSGSVRDEMYYFAYTKDARGAIFLRGFPASCSVIYEDMLNPKDAFAYFEVSYNPIGKWWFSRKGRKLADHPMQYGTTMPCGCNCNRGKYELHVPKGTVIREFILK